jgi:proline dehydrogenase
MGYRGDPIHQPVQQQLPDLGNTQVAFADRSDRELKEAEFLFRILGNPLISSLGQKMTLIALGIGLPVAGLIKRTIFKQFCGGETIDESLRTAERLYRSGIGSILDYSAEGQETEASFDASVKEIVRTISTAAKRQEVPFCVFKPSGIGSHPIWEKKSKGQPFNASEAKEWQRLEERMKSMCEASYNAGVPILIDAEESWIQPAIDELVEQMMAQYNKQKAIVFNTIQFYRHDRLAFLRSAIQRARAGGYHLGIKLVRGAYMEKERARAEEMGYPSPIHENKQRVDDDYNAGLKECLVNIDRMAIVAGSHNEGSTLLLAELMQRYGLAIDDDRIWFSQLLGMSDNISYNLSAAGYNVVKYVPYGPVKKVLPYLIRRAAENSSVAGQTGRELKMIRKELLRRRT